uniref:Reverse transcriptase zinc-binding domain-containing protein n=1 Tax=Cannabis sativa TaxID=3483 RepID=A0A803QFX1_CANSA
MRKVVGDGRSIQAFRDPWIPQPRTFRPITAAPSGSVMVQELIDGSGAWDLNALSHYFLRLDIDAILSIPLRNGGCEDQWCWHYTSNGCYTVKSGYVVALDLATERNGGSSVNQASWWNDLWKLKIPQKVKIFLWRMYHRALPANSQLIKRNIPVQPICHRCGEAMETPKHALVFCSSLLPIWSELRVWSQFNRCRNGPLAELLVCLFSMIEQSKFELLAMVWWWVWSSKGHHGVLLVGLGGPRGDVSGWVMGLLGGVGTAEARGGLVCPTRWCPPEMGEFVLSVDAAVTSGRGFARFGGVIRGGKGVVWAAWAEGGVGDYQVVVAELLAVRTGLLWAARLGYNLVRVETDSSVVSSWINCPSSIIMFKPIVEEIHSLLAVVGGSFCCAILRVANGVAHALAKSVTSSVGVQLWTDACPRFISTPVTTDFI